MPLGRSGAQAIPPPCRNFHLPAHYHRHKYPPRIIQLSGRGAAW